MKLDHQALAAKWNLKLILRHHATTLGKLFPPDHPLSPSMWRLAIVRDDIDWECDNMRVATGAASAGGEAEAFWRFAYYSRRLSLSILEAKNLLEEGDLLKVLKLQARRHPSRAPIYSGVKDLATELRGLESLLRPVRDSIGAHVRPNNANPARAGNGPSYEVQGLQSHSEHQGRIARNAATGFGTSYRELTRLSFLFPWPEVQSFEALMDKTATYIAPMTAAARHVLAAIDAILLNFWVDVGGILPADAARLVDET